MAKAKQQKSQGRDNTDFDSDELDLPEGFSRANPVDADPLYWSPSEGAILRGELTGRFQRRDKDGWFYQIKLTTSANVRKADGEEREAEPGEVVNVDERAGLRHLATYCGVAEKRFEVFIKAKEKVDIRGGKTFWKFALGAKELH